MKIAVADVGYVGLSLEVPLAQKNQVFVISTTPTKVDMINNKKSPIQDNEIEKMKHTEKAIVPIEKTYLVTGAAGFIGFHLSKKLLEDSYQMIGIDNLNDYYDPELKRSRLEILEQYNNFTFHKGRFKKQG
jgi:hypothetical protein